MGMSSDDLLKLYGWIRKIDDRVSFLETLEQPYDGITESAAGIVVSGEFLVDGMIREDGAFAHIYTVSAVAAQNIPSAAWTKITGFTNNGESSNCSALAGTDKITITKTGRYLLVWDCGGFPATADNFQFSIYVNGAITVLRTIVGSSGVNIRTQYSISGIIDVKVAGQDVEVYVRQASGGALNFTPVHMGLSVLYIGET